MTVEGGKGEKVTDTQESTGVIRGDGVKVIRVTRMTKGQNGAK